MTHKYQVSGITCEGCVSKVKSLLEKIPGVTAATVSVDGKVELNMGYDIATTDLQAALRDYPKYQLEDPYEAPTAILAAGGDSCIFWETYKPILLVFSYILGATVLVEAASGAFDWMRGMRHFMAGFFLVFSFFKMLDVPNFAASYSSYDVLARRWLGWGYAYPFIELVLGALFLLDYNPLITNSLTFAVMGVSTIGVVQSLLAKRKFQCACLGALFNLPMSQVTLFEDVLMVVMSGVMLLIHL